MAAQLRSFRGHFLHATDPDAGGNGLQTAFRPDAAAGQPATLLERSQSSVSAIVFLGLDTNTSKPEMAINPVRAPVAAGQAPSTNWYCWGADFTREGQQPMGRAITSNALHLALANRVPPVAEMGPAWVAHGGALLLPSAVLGATAEDVDTRNMYAVPFIYCEPVLQAHADGTLSCQWLWESIAQPIVDAGGADLIKYQAWVDHIRVMCTQRVNPTAGGADLPPAIARNLAGAPLPESVRNMMQAER